MTKRVRNQEEEEKYSPRLLEAQLVATHGFSCPKDLASFIRSIGGDFKDWCLNHICDYVFMFGSVHSKIPKENLHHVTSKQIIYKRHIPVLRPKDWFHLPHIVTEHINIPPVISMTVSIITENDAKIISHLTLIHDGVVLKGWSTGAADMNLHYAHNEAKKVDRFIVSYKMKTK
jgi:hypothetical protein